MIKTKGSDVSLNGCITPVLLNSVSFFFGEPESRNWTESYILHMSKEGISRSATDEKGWAALFRGWKVSE
jgi:hypothetical protein